MMDAEFCTAVAKSFSSGVSGPMTMKFLLHESAPSTRDVVHAASSRALKIHGSRWPSSLKTRGEDTFADADIRAVVEQRDEERLRRLVAREQQRAVSRLHPQDMVLASTPASTPGGLFKPIATRGTRRVGEVAP